MSRVFSNGFVVEARNHTIIMHYSMLANLDHIPQAVLQKKEE